MNASDDLLADDPLGAGGALAQHIDGFVARPAQQAMAAAVAAALAARGELLVEAGTGTGKTYAYLVPALRSEGRVIISTGTKALQDQLFKRDLPRVARALELTPHAALLKGRANYLCLHRLQLALGDGRGGAQETHQLAQIRQWSAATRSGDRAELAAVPEDAPIWPRVTSTTENCLGGTCPQFEECWLVKARRAAQEAQIVVVNHHLLLADLALKQDGFGEILPGAAAFVMDEAHQLPELAGQFFTETLSHRQLSDLAQDTLAECSGVSGALAALSPVVDALQQALREARLALEALPERGALDALEDPPALARALESLALALREFSAALETQAPRAKGLAAVYERTQRAGELLARLRALESPGDSVRWYERHARGYALHATPLDVAKPLQALRARMPAAWIYTSATLTVAGRFDHLVQRLGLQAPRTLLLQSPFDYARQALCYLPPRLPEPQARDYTECVLQALLPVLAASRGRAFLLFTSHRALKLAAEWLPARMPWPLFVQGSAPRHELLEQFRASGHGVLLGAASFWAGVDVAGEALSVVAMDKLPFEAPGDPVLEARLRALREAGENPFAAWQVPNAVIAFKQGAGRLIRSIDDRGVLVLCDPRLGARGYGKLFMASLPDMPRSQRIEDVQAFFAAAPVTATVL
ncbi:ATP-dependent DNA helicase [Metallibacterium scheffleri]